MSAVVEAVEDVVETVVDAAGDVVDFAVDVVEDAGKAIEKTVEKALDDPIATIATIAAVASGNPQLIPYINGANTLAKGGDFEDAVKSAAISYVAQGAGEYVGDTLGTSLEYGTDLGSAQTSMLAQQTGDMLGGTTAGTIGSAAGAAAAGATAAGLSGGDVDQAMINALGNYLVRTGVNYSFNEAGKLVDSMGNEAPPDVVDQITADAENQLIEFEPRYEPSDEGGGTIVNNGDGTYTQTFDDGSTQTVDTNMNVVESTTSGGEVVAPPAPELPTAPLEIQTTPVQTAPAEVTPVETAPAPAEEQPVSETVTNNGNGTFTQTFDDGSTLTTDAIGNVIQSTTYDGEIIPPSSPVPVGDPYEVDNTGTRDEADILTGTTPVEKAPVSSLTFNNSTITQNPDGTYTQTFDDGSTQTFDENWQNITSTQSTDTAVPGLNMSGIGNYLKNQFSNQLTRELFGGSGTRTGLSTLASRPGAAYSSVPGASFLTGMSGFGAPEFSETPQQELSESATFSGLFDPTSSMVWAPQTKIGGLGSPGKYVNQESDTYYVNKDQELRQKARENLANRGWLTEEEQAALDQDPYFDYGEDSSFFDQGDVLQAAQGGLIDHNPEFYSEGGASLANRYVRGGGNGTSDSVPAMLAAGEFVIPADVVSSLGNGDNNAGAQTLDKFMAAIRKHKRNAAPNDLPPDSKGPLAYLAEAMKKGKQHGRT